MNKPRLIDANKLKPILYKATGGSVVIDQIIDDQPTAYDIDKVVEQLKKFNVRKGCELECPEYYPSVDRCSGDCYAYIKHKTIAIVKGGAGSE